MKIFIITVLLLLGSGLASAQELFPIQQSQIVVAGGGCSDTDSGMGASLGLTCNPAVSDDFDGTAVDTTKWTPYGATLLTVQNGYLTQEATPTNDSGMTTTHAENLNRPLYVEIKVRYRLANGTCLFCGGGDGYRFQEWSCGQTPGLGTGFQAFDACNNQFNPVVQSVNVPEIDFNETFANNLRVGFGEWNYDSSQGLNVQGYQLIQPTTAQTLGDNTNWHIIGMLLSPNGGTYGSVQWWVDGVSQGTISNGSLPAVLSGALSNLKSGYVDVFSGYCNTGQGACTQNGFQDVDYIHVYQPGSGGGGQPTIKVNGQSSGVSVPSGSSVTVAVTNGPGNPADWVGLCADNTTCNTYSDWDYLYGCTKTVPGVGITSGSCNLNAASPSSNTTYYADFFPNNQHANILASEPFTVTAGGTGGGSCTSSVGYNDGSTIPCPAGSQAGGPAAPPSGYHWNLVWYDNFYKDTSLDLSKWCNIYLNSNASCNLSTNLAFDSVNGLSIYASPPSSNNNVYVRSGIIESDGNGVAGSAPGSHVYGIWEWSIKQPTDVSGEGDEFHSDVWFHSNHGFDGYPPSPDFIEWDVGEKANGIYSNNSTELWCGACNNSNYNTENVFYPDGDLSAGFHTLSGYWIQDSNPAGSAEVLFDGVLQFPNNSPTPLQSPSYWLNGLWNTITLDGCNPNSGLPCSQQTLTDSTNNPFQVKYARYWQLAPN